MPRIDNSWEDEYFDSTSEKDECRKNAYNEIIRRDIKLCNEMILRGDCREKEVIEEVEEILMRSWMADCQEIEDEILSRINDEIWAYEDDPIQQTYFNN